MVYATKKDIEDNLSCRTRFFIEKEYINLLIGLRGENIQDLNEALKVHIDINRKTGEVVVTGARCEEALRA